MKNDINLLTLRKYTVETSKKHSYVLFGIFFSVILAAGIVLPSRSLSDAQLKLNALDLELKKTTVTQESLNETMRKASQLGSQLSDLQMLYVSRSDILSYLSALERSLPNTAELAQLAFSGNVLNIAGTAPDDKTVATFLLHLRNSRAFSSVFLTGSTSPSAKTSETMFTITATLPAPLSGAALVAEGDAGTPAESVTPAVQEVQP